MIKIKKKTNILILILVIISFIGINHSMDIQIKLLETEIEELEEYQKALLEQKRAYEELVKLQEELEINLSFQVKLLENNLSRLQEENESLRTIRAKLTAYSPLDNVDGRQAEGNPSKTSRGFAVGRKYAAADPKKIPYGTVLEIPNYGVVEIQDTGSALRKDNKNIRLDLYHDTYNQAMKFGVKDMEVKILEWGGD